MRGQAVAHLLRRSLARLEMPALIVTAQTHSHHGTSGVTGAGSGAAVPVRMIRPVSVSVTLGDSRGRLGREGDRAGQASDVVRPQPVFSKFTQPQRLLTDRVDERRCLSVVESGEHVVGEARMAGEHFDIALRSRQEADERGGRLGRVPLRQRDVESKFVGELPELLRRRDQRALTRVGSALYAAPLRAAE